MEGFMVEERIVGQMGEKDEYKSWICKSWRSDCSSLPLLTVYLRRLSLLHYFSFFRLRSLLRLLIDFSFFASADLILLYIVRPGLRQSRSSLKATEKHPCFLSSFSLLYLSSLASVCSHRQRTSLSVSLAGEKILFPLLRSPWCPRKPLLLPLLLSQLE